MTAKEIQGLNPFYKGLNRVKPDLKGLMLAMTQVCPDNDALAGIQPPGGSVWQDVYEYGFLVARVIRLPDQRIAVFRHDDLQNEGYVGLMIGLITQSFADTQ